MNLGKFSEIFDKKKTFRPKKKFQPGTMKYSLHKQAQASLNSGINLRQVVKLPKVRRHQNAIQEPQRPYKHAIHNHRILKPRHIKRQTMNTGLPIIKQI